MPNPEQIREALRRVIEPNTGLDVVSAELIDGLIVDGGEVRLNLSVLDPRAAQRDSLRKAAEEAIRAVAGVTGVQVLPTWRIVARQPNPSSQRLPEVKNIIAVAAGKGGVGKSTVTTNLAAALAQLGARVGIMDADVYGPSVPQMMGAPLVPPATTEESKITPAVHHGMPVMSIGFFVERDAAVIWRGPMIHKLLQQFMEDVEWGPLDYLVVDLPPGTGDTQLSLSQLLPVTGAVMVTTPQEVSILDVEKALSMWEKVQVPVLGVIENMSYYVCPHCGHTDEIFSRGGGKQLAEREKVPFLGEIPLESKVRDAGDTGTPVTLAVPESPVSQAFRDIAGQVAAALSARNLPRPGGAKRSSKLSVMR